VGQYHAVESRAELFKLLWTLSENSTWGFAAASGSSSSALEAG